MDERVKSTFTKFLPKQGCLVACAFSCRCPTYITQRSSNKKVTAEVHKRTEHFLRCNRFWLLFQIIR